MNETREHLPQDEPAVYQIQVDGRIDENLLDWFEEMTLSTEMGADGKPVTMLVGPVADQAALHGLLSRIYTLGFLVISVARVEGNQ